jgi:hypothetical protein
MSPLIQDGYILAVDSSQTEISDLNGNRDRLASRPGTDGFPPESI